MTNIYRILGPVLVNDIPYAQSQKRIALKDSESESSFARMSKRFSRSLKNLIQNDGKAYETSDSP